MLSERGFPLRYDTWTVGWRMPRSLWVELRGLTVGLKHEALVGVFMRAPICFHLQSSQFLEYRGNLAPQPTDPKKANPCSNFGGLTGNILGKS